MRPCKAAAAALPAWRAAPALRRARVLMRFRELLDANKKELRKIITQEHGKTLVDAEGEITRGLEVVEFATGIPHLLKGEHSENVGTGVDAYSIRQPVGVCAGITPFNFPAMVPMWMFPVAIACGNTFVLKPSERDPTTSLRLAELLKEAGLPDGVFNVVHGDKESVDALLAHPDVRAISFVGSTPIARYIYETGTRNGKRVQALGGAKNHAIVMPDADLPFTVEAIIGAGYGSAGERCMAISAIVAVGDVADKLVEGLAQRARKVTTGRGEADVEMGPVVTCAARDRIKGLIDQGCDGRCRHRRRRSRHQGRRPRERVLRRADAVRPCEARACDLHGRDLRTGARRRPRRVARRRRSRSSIAIPYANGVALFTRSGYAARRFQEDTEVGMIGINVPIPVPMAFYSFGGWRNSLFGDLHVHGMDGVRFYTRGKAVTTRWPDDGSAAPGFHMPLMG